MAKIKESDRDYSDYTSTQLLQAYKILEVAEIGLPQKDRDKDRKTLCARRAAIAKELADRTLLFSAP
jgi:hypothetical protein